ncbi:MAG: hypothetical protein LBD75_00265 [Candidatus Peribacteria bacterium]|jgi:hypothetical protein|nr:hypothetical protein [Candidatus Peribacteria bacterium]
MKKFLFCCCAWGIAVANLSYAYTPTATDTQQLTSLKNVLTTTSNADLRKYYQQFVTLEKAVNTSDEKLDYFLTHLRDFSYSQFTLQKNLAKQGSTSVKSDLLQTYKDNIFLNESLSSNCL